MQLVDIRGRDCLFQPIIVPDFVSAMEDRWRCAQCSSPFSKSKLLEAHARLTKHKAYNCTKDAECQKSFSLRTALIRHEASHTTQKKHACKRCNKTFHRRDHCQEHESVCRGDLEANGPATLDAEGTSRSKEFNAAFSLTEMRSQAQSTSQANIQDFSENGGSNALSQASTQSQDPVAGKDNKRRKNYALSWGAALEKTKMNKRVLCVYDGERRLWKDDTMLDVSEHDAYSVSSYPARTTYSSGPTPEFPMNLTSMEQSVERSPGPLQSSQDSLNVISTPERSTDTRANTGTYTCTYHRCTHRFDSPATLQKHKRDYHRSQQRTDSVSSFSTSESSDARTHQQADHSVTIGGNTILQGDSVPGDGSPFRIQKHPATFRCNLCPKRYTRSATLREHLRTHTDERPFVCGVCGKAFVRQHDRKRHEDLHSGERRYVCKGDLQSGSRWGCGRRFARADGLGRHFRSEAGRICIRPLLDEEAAERQREWLEELQQVQMTAGSASHAGAASIPTDTLGNFLPAAILAQYPALAEIDWSAIPQDHPAEEDYTSRSSFNGSITTRSPKTLVTDTDSTQISQRRDANDDLILHSLSQDAGQSGDNQEVRKHGYIRALEKELLRLQSLTFNNVKALPLISSLYSSNQDAYIKTLEEEVLRLKRIYVNESQTMSPPEITIDFGPPDDKTRFTPLGAR